MVKIFHSDRFVPALPKGHRFPIAKYQLIREQLLYEGTISEDQLEESHPMDEKVLLEIHDKSYWSQMKSLSLGAREVRKIGFPMSAQLVNRSLRSCQGTLSASIYAWEHGVGMNIAGGTHHAYRGHGEGFCLLNDLAISASWMLEHYPIQKILVIDLDVHQGNGTAKIFAGDERVFTFSVHGADNYPLRKEQSDLDIPLPTHTGDDDYLRVVEDQIDRLINQQKPQLIFFQAGVDVLETDKLGKLSLSRKGCKLRDYLVVRVCKKYEIPLVVVMGGGYSERLADTVEAHANTFRVVQEVWGWECT